MARSKRKFRKTTANTLRAQQAVINKRGGSEDSNDEPNYVPPNDPMVLAIIASPQYRAAMGAIGEKMADAARDAAPEETGDLIESIESGVTPQGSIIVSVGVDYGVFVDQGTSAVKARPFLSGAALDVGV